MKARKWKEPLCFAAFLAAAALAVHFAAAVLRPSHTTYGGYWAGYECEPRDTVDVLFMGSSYAYCDWNPGIIYDETGLVSYVMAGSEQVSAVTYWYLRQALKTQSPKAVVLEGSSLLFEQYRNHMDHNVCYMPWGLERIMATIEGAPPEDRLGLFFDLYLYHDRWKEITRSDVAKAIRLPTADQNKGHTAITYQEEKYQGSAVTSGLTIPEEQYAANMENLARIAGLCREKGIDLIVTINPTHRQYTQEVYDRLEADVLAAGEGVRFVNWSDRFEDVGLIPEEHLFDAGHLNAAGARLFSVWTGEYLQSLGYTPREQSEENRLAWEETARYWREQA